jgi:hypothetical protein
LVIINRHFIHSHVPQTFKCPHSQNAHQMPVETP